MSIPLSFRVAAVVASVLCAAAALEAQRIVGEGGSRAALIAAIVLAAGAVWTGIGAVIPGLLIGPVRRIRPAERLWSELQRCDIRLQAGDASPPFTRLAIAMLMAGCVCFAANVYVQAFNPPSISTDDQGAYLERAAEIQSPISPLFTLPQLFQDLRSGRFREDNRHPLFLGLLALHPEEGTGRLIAWSFGLAAFFSGVWMVWRRFSLLTAGVFALLLGMNADLALFSVTIVCETLLIWWMSLAYFVLLPPADASRSTNRRRVRILMASTFLGFAYLTKATGLLFFGVFLAWLAWQSRPRRDDELPDELETNTVLSPNEADPLRQMVIALLFGVMGFVVVAEPLIERNLRVFKNPFHNVNSLLLFTDDYSQFDNLLLGGVTTREAAEDYFRTHTFGDMLNRELNGLVWEAFIMLRTLGPQGLDDGRIILGLPIAVCCFIGLWFERRPAKSLLIAWIITCWVVFAWYVPIAAGDRFPIPLLLPVLAHAAEGIRRLVLIGRT